MPFVDPEDIGGPEAEAGGTDECTALRTTHPEKVRRLLPAHERDRISWLIEWQLNRLDLVRWKYDIDPPGVMDLALGAVKRQPVPLAAPAVA